MGNDLTYSVLDGIALRQASLPDDALDPVLRRVLIDAEVDRLWEEYKDDPFYRFTTLLALAPDVEFLADLFPPNNGVIAGIRTSDQTILRLIGSFQAGSLVDLTLWNASSELITMRALLRLLSSGPLATYEVLAGTVVNFTPGGTQRASVTVIRSLSAASADFSPLYFDRILAVKDDVTRSTQVAFDEVTDPTIFSDLVLSPTKSRRVAFYRRAGAIDFFVPASGPALGVVTVQYAGRPGRYTKATENETILIPRERNAVLIAAVTAAFQKSAVKPKEAPAA